VSAASRKLPPLLETAIHRLCVLKTLKRPSSQESKSLQTRATLLLSGARIHFTMSGF
jgi:hypothetical protein